MKYYFAPLEGITGYAFRGVHHEMFPGIDNYFTPFISAKQTLTLETKEKKDIDPQNNAGISLVPQIMSNKANEFLWAAHEIQSRGYDTVNLNLGCPMPTIVTKRKGSGMLADLDSLESFLDAIFDGTANGGPRISIKTRLGKENLDQACRIIELYNRYPMTELIVHPRSQKDLYKGKANREIFAECMNITKQKICYNGDIFSREDHDAFMASFPQTKYPQIEAIMLGRGIIANPALLREIQGGTKLTKRELRQYHDTLYKTYEAQNYGLSPLLHRMKELWFYFGSLFIDSEKAIHKIRIAKTIENYRPAVETIFQTGELGGQFNQ